LVLPSPLGTFHLFHPSGPWAPGLGRATHPTTYGGIRCSTPPSTASVEASSPPSSFCSRPGPAAAAMAPSDPTRPSTRSSGTDRRGAHPRPCDESLGGGGAHRSGATFDLHVQPPGQYSTSPSLPPCPRAPRPLFSMNANEFEVDGVTPDRPESGQNAGVRAGPPPLRSGWAADLGCFT